MGKKNALYEWKENSIFSREVLNSFYRTFFQLLQRNRFDVHNVMMESAIESYWHSIIIHPLVGDRKNVYQFFIQTVIAIRDFEAEVTVRYSGMMSGNDRKNWFRQTKNWEIHTTYFPLIAIKIWTLGWNPTNVWWQWSLLWSALTERAHLALQRWKVEEDCHIRGAKRRSGCKFAGVWMASTFWGNNF